MDPVSWRKIFTLAGILVAALWSMMVFLDANISREMDSLAQNQKLMRAYAAELEKRFTAANAELVGMKVEIVQIKCRLNPDMCGEGK